ncbi:hypothetical protein P7K49_011916 [Saguinus oedipus]|uniref:Uncharacterized protein n=1 Tax=Saguinus oedipus TaxID=9490 RepID=A0ABQ9VS18_SAGOE|nr:hypothetical protein P7K49_011916 [Saguinus oedipus]
MSSHDPRPLATNLCCEYLVKLPGLSVEFGGVKLAHDHEHRAGGVRWLPLGHLQLGAVPPSSKVGPARHQGQRGRGRGGGTEEAEKAWLTGPGALRSSHSQPGGLQAAGPNPKARGEMKAAQSGCNPLETFEVGRDSILGPVSQEHHGGQVGPS